MWGFGITVFKIHKIQSLKNRMYLISHDKDMRNYRLAELMPEINHYFNAPDNLQMSIDKPEDTNMDIAIKLNNYLSQKQEKIK